MALFLITVLCIWVAMHVYVFWRLGSIPWVAGRIPRRWRRIAAVVLAASYVIARNLDGLGLHAVSWPVEYVAANWIGILFLLVSAFLIVDLFTLGGRLFRKHVTAVRGWAVAAAGLLTVIALVQALRPPVVREYTVTLPNLPPERNGTTLVAISDLHLGNLLGRRWLARLVDQVNALQPNLVAVVGDLVDGNVGAVDPLRQELRRLKAPLGVWAVTGNHEFYAGVDQSVRLFEQTGFHVLRNRHAEVVPGLVLAGVDDLTAQRQFGRKDRTVEETLANRPAGATIFLSHTPWQAETAAAAGAGLMLSGHTHHGQIWPFNYLVALRYPLMAGRYEVNGMSVIVSRGAGTWGPRMRLWRPSEIIHVRLQSAAENHVSRVGRSRRIERPAGQ